ncbi:MAG: nucleotidyltransferase family protein [Prosthecobacter sp.]|uniref:nucleotidyltransferase family protein n=1 Tax=Prosthecobacter sp. TaxID=1965333 RepID=UPI003902140B
MTTKPLETFCLPPDATLLRALQVIDEGGEGISFMVDAGHKLLGTVTDGDVRRALLKGVALTARIEPHAKKVFSTVTASASRAEVIDLMQARQLHQIPIIDDQGRLAGLHLLHEILGAMPKPNWAVIMAGGKGTRLGKLTQSTPKPMLKVAGRPIIERLVLHFVGCGIRRIFISVNHLAGIIEDHFGNGSRFGCQIEYLRERTEHPLGTGGSLSLLPEAPEHPVFVCNGDLVTQVDFDSLAHFHASGGYLATVGVRSYVHEIPFGCLEVVAGRVTNIVEKPTLSQPINAGIYMLSPEIIRRVPEKYFPITELFDEAVRLGDKVGAFEIVDDWIDVGQHEQLKLARGHAH